MGPPSSRALQRKNVTHTVSIAKPRLKWIKWTFLHDEVLGAIFFCENVNLMYFVHDVVIESLVVMRYRVYLWRETVKLSFFRRVFVKQA